MSNSRIRLRYVLFVNAQDTCRHTASANTAIYPNLGLLTLMSALEARPESQHARLGYFDGTVHGNRVLEEFIDREAPSIFALCFSVLTANYGSSLLLARRARRLNPDILVVMGNDHFSAMHERAMLRQEVIDYGFCGNDVVTGFADLLSDSLAGRVRSLDVYPGLVFRHDGAVHVNGEFPAEYGSLPLVKYDLMDSIFPHKDAYLAGQRETYLFMRDRALRSQVVDIGRGCIKFAGPRLDSIPLNACDFCAITPGVREISSPGVRRAWDIIENVHDQGFNYLYVTADELPLTLWPLLSGMAADIPDWYRDLRESERPSMFGYARAEAFAVHPERIRMLIETLRFDHFFIGFDGLTNISLRVMNKQAAGGRGRRDPPMEHNIRAFDAMVQSGGMITAGIVMTHLGITRDLLEENFASLREIVAAHPSTFAALDFGPLCPIPGSQAFRYLTHPEYAQTRAAQFGLRVNLPYLQSRRDFYRVHDEFDMDELVEDFVRGCCPDIDMADVERYLERITALANDHDIVVGGGV